MIHKTNAPQGPECPVCLHGWGWHAEHCQAHRYARELLAAMRAGLDPSWLDELDRRPILQLTEKNRDRCDAGELLAHMSGVLRDAANILRHAGGLRGRILADQIHETATSLLQEGRRCTGR